MPNWQVELGGHGRSVKHILWESLRKDLGMGVEGVMMPGKWVEWKGHFYHHGFTPIIFGTSKIHHESIMILSDINLSDPEGCPDQTGPQISIQLVPPCPPAYLNPEPTPAVWDLHLCSHPIPYVSFSFPTLFLLSCFSFCLKRAWFSWPRLSFSPCFCTHVTWEAFHLHTANVLNSLMLIQMYQVSEWLIRLCYTKLQCQNLKLCLLFLLFLVVPFDEFASFLSSRK